MDHFHYINGEYGCEDVPLSRIAQQVGTPCYVYSRATILRHWHAFHTALQDRPHLICYAVKANSNLAVLNLLAELGSGFDIVSGGELQRVLHAGGDAGRVVSSGVCKTAQEIGAGLEANIRCFNVESMAELERINAIAGNLGKRAPISLRVNPDVDARTHPYISTGLKDNKFGIDIADALQAYQYAASLAHVEITGIDCHIGSQLTQIEPFVDALNRVLALADQLAQHAITIQHLDIGGGLGITYRDETPPSPEQYVHALLKQIGDRPYEILIEPGRAIVGNAGVLVTQVEYLKPGTHKNFAIVDAAMNDLLRPALYDAWQDIVTVTEHPQATALTYDVVGPVCETGDFLGKQRKLGISAGDLLAVRSAGAYGFTMSSNYNSRPRAAEVLVDGDTFTIIRERETFAQLIAGEHLPKPTR